MMKCHFSYREHGNIVMMYRLHSWYKSVICALFLISHNKPAYKGRKFSYVPIKPLTYGGLRTGE